MTTMLETDMPMTDEVMEPTMEEKVLARFAEFENATVCIQTGWNYRLNLGTAFKVYTQGREINKLASTIQRLVDEGRIEKSLHATDVNTKGVDYVQYKLIW